MIKNTKILWLVPKCTIPATDGAKVATESLLASVVSLGASVDLACMTNEGNIAPEDVLKSKLGIEKLYLFQRGKTRVGMIYRFFKEPFMPLTMNSFSDKKAKNFIKECIVNKKYDVIVMDGLHLCAPFLFKNEIVIPKNTKIVYRAHNVEHQLWSEGAKKTKNPIKKLVLYWQGQLVRQIEMKVAKFCDVIAPISNEDTLIISDFTNKKKIIHTPLGLKFKKIKRYESKGLKEFLFIGKLDWQPNRQGLEWFLKSVWPKVDHEKCILHICGSGDSKWIQKYVSMSGIEFHGFVQDVDFLYAKVDACIAPIFFGSGTRIKVLEPYTKNRVVITTELGAQGSDLVAGEDFIQANKQEEWIDAIENFSKQQAESMVNSACNKLFERLDQRRVAYDFCRSFL